MRKRIYVGTDRGRVLRVDSANVRNNVVTTLRVGQANTSVTCVAVDPTNEQHLLVTSSNYGIVSVFETTNANAPTPTWTAVEGNLPDMPVWWAMFDPANPSRAILATEMGIYSTELLIGGSTVWDPSSTGMVNTRIHMLRYRTGDQLVAAATFGRGLYTSDLFATTALASKPAAASAVLTSAYPNPFTSQLNLQLGAEATGELTATLTDALGRRVLSTTQRAANRQATVPVPAGLAPGHYVLTVRSGTRQTSLHVTKQ